MRNKTFASLAVASALGLLTPAAQAFGLGKLELYSALNEPFKAEIAVTTLRGEEAENLQVKLASNQEFDKAGLERNFVLAQFEFKVIQKDGVTYVSVSSDTPVKEPLLDFLVIATTGEGRLIREYTVLLDPPKNILAKPKPVKKSAELKKGKAETEVKITSYQYPQSDQTTYNSDVYGPINKTETLWKIALNTRPETSLSVNQMMMALLEANPNAFNRNNINGLKAGYTLDIPSIDAIRKLDKTAAISAVTEQNEQWKNRGKTKVEAEMVADVEGAPASEMPMRSSDVVTADDMTSDSEIDLTMSEGSSDETMSRLKLVVPTDEASLNDDSLAPQGDDQITLLSEQLTFAQETIEAQAQENIDFKSRMDAMDEQLQTMRRLISLKDADLARLQSLLEEEQEVEAVGGDAEAIVEEALAILNQSDTGIELSAENGLEVEVMEDLDNSDADTAFDTMPSTVEDENLMFDETESEEVATTEIEDTVDVDTVEESLDLSPLPSVDDMVATTSKLINVDEQEIQDVITQVKTYVAENKMTTMLGSLLILLALWLIIRRLNRPDVTWDEAVEKYDIDDGASSASIATTDTQLDEQLEQDDTGHGSQVETDNVKTVDELIKQADMFVGYADYTQAKSSLEQAGLLVPDNREVLAKMLFVLYKQHNVDEFISVVGQNDFDSASPEWDDIAGWGRELAPENTLFAVAEVSEPEAVAPIAQPEEESPVNDIVADNDVSQEPEHLEFNIDDFKVDDAEEKEDEHVETANDDELMSFDTTFDLDDDREQDSTEDESATTAFDAPLILDIDSASSSEEDSLDEPALSLDIDVSASDDIEDQDELAAISEDELDAASKELSGQLDSTSDVEFDLGDFDEIDEAETKLDLAAAYIDMGDPEGAKSILEEVQSEGNDEQKSRAQKLLNELSK
ncbi:hypothetical protein A9Q79_10455 [Methylophaga sp. 42_25_T18]|nr:hypothetical protein A9Q79_10455 [Methylophaga sp. 42_25_T18]